MKNITLLISILLVFFITKSYSQERNLLYEEIGLVPQSSSKAALPNYPGPYCLKVKFHIVRQSNGSGGYSPSNLEQIITNLNNYFNDVNIFFNNIGYDYINNSALYDITYDPFHIYPGNTTELYELYHTNEDPNALDVYLVNSVTSDPFIGDPYPVSSTSAYSHPLITMANSAATSKNVVKSIGRTLSLLPTNYGSSIDIYPSEIPDPCEELPNGSNCTTCGDLVCDTPADPGLNSSNFNSSTCTYTGGGGYNPDVTNLMSNGGDCRNSFTPGQGVRMRNLLGTSSDWSTVKNSSCDVAELEGPPLLCPSQTAIFSVQYGAPPYSWSSSSNVTILPPTNGSSVTAQAGSGNIRAPGYVRVSSPGGIETQYFWIGKPKVSPLLVPDISVPEKLVTAHLINSSYDPGGQEITNVVWQKTGGNGNLHVLNQFEALGSGPIHSAWYIDVDVQLTNNCGTTTIQFTIAPPPPPLREIAPYPNEADEAFSLDFSEMPKESYDIKIFDIQMNVLYSGQSSNSIKTIETVNFSEGIYILEFSDANGNSIRKQLLVKHR